MFTLPSPDGPLTPSGRSNDAGIYRRTLDPGEALSVPSGSIQDRQVDYLAAARRNRWILVLFPILGLAAGYAFSLTQPPVYQARTMLEIRALNDNFLNNRELSQNGALTDSSIEPYIEAQVEVIREPSLVGKVVDDLRLDQRKEAHNSRDLAIRLALHSLTVNPISAARMLRITYESTDRELSAKFVNDLARQYNQQKIDSSLQAARATTAWLANQSQQLKQKLEQSELDLQDYARNTGLIYTNDNRDSAAEEKLRTLDRDLATAQSDRIAKQSQLAMVAAGNPEMLPQVVASARVQEYQGKLTELHRQRAELLALLTPQNYKVQRIDAQIAEIESAIKMEMTKIPEALRNDFSAAQKREELLTAAYTEQAKQVSSDAIKAIHYLTLKQQVDTTRTLHAAFMQRTEQAAMMAALPESNIHVLTPAEAPLAPYKPNRFFIASLGLFAGIFGGVVLTGIRELKDSTIKVPRECSGPANLPLLGVIPSAKVDLKGFAPARWMRGRESLRRKLDRVSLEGKNSILAESFRGTLASLCFSGAGAPIGRVLVFTSPGPHEGKTTVVSNVGLALASIDRKVLLINGDSRHPRLHDIFELDQRQGLSDVLKDTCDLATCDLSAYITRPGNTKLAVMGSGRARQISGLLYSDRLPMLLARLRLDFDMVLIDSPPVMQISDARILARTADGVVLVVRAGATTMNAAADAASRFAADETRILGTILNDWDPKAGDSETLQAFSKMYRHYYSYSNS